MNTVDQLPQLVRQWNKCVKHCIQWDSSFKWALDECLETRVTKAGHTKLSVRHTQKNHDN